MKPGPVSVKAFQPCFPQTSSNQVDPIANPEGLLLNPVAAGDHSFE
jgi:hypothetical protein